MHELLDLLASNLRKFGDQIVERVATIGGVPSGTVEAAAKTTTIEPYPIGLMLGEEVLTAVADRLGAFSNKVRSSIEEATNFEDEVTADLLTDIAKELEKKLLFIEAHLEDEDAEGLSPRSSSSSSDRSQSADSRERDEDGQFTSSTTGSTMSTPPRATSRAAKTTGSSTRSQSADKPKRDEDGRFVSESESGSSSSKSGSSGSSSGSACKSSGGSKSASRS